MSSVGSFRVSGRNFVNSVWLHVFQSLSCAWPPSWLVGRIRRSSYWLPWTWGWSLTVMFSYRTTPCCTPCPIRSLSTVAPNTLISNVKPSVIVSTGMMISSEWRLFSSLPNQDMVFNQLTNNTQLRHAYGSVLTVTMASDQSFYEAFRQRQFNREIRSAVAATQVNTTNTQQALNNHCKIKTYCTTSKQQQIIESSHIKNPY